MGILPVARGKGKLGVLLKTTPHCYAAAIGASQIGVCSQKHSLEHPLSAALRKNKTLTVEIAPVAPSGGSPFKTTVSIANLSAPILCERHNNDLSAVDLEAVKLQAALVEMEAVASSPLVAPGVIRNVNGWLIARWMCKYYCGCMAMQNRVPQQEFVRYAFGLAAGARRVCVLFPARLQDKVRLADSSQMPLTTLTGASGDEGFRLVFEGLPAIVSLFPATAPEMAGIVGSFPEGTEFIDRLEGLQHGKGFKIVLNWNGDPDRGPLKVVTPSQ